MTVRTRFACLTSLSALALCAAASASAATPSVIISPTPGTIAAMPQTQISFLGAAAGSLSSISVVGSSTGSHRGALRSYSSATGTSFLPLAPFAAGEQVTVQIGRASCRERV